MKKLYTLLFLSIATSVFAQQGGMWIPSLLEGINEKEMQSLGMKLSASDIYNVNHSSLKDAVPHFNGGCTSEIISDKGLLLTNHHCGYSQIQSHSSVEHNYLESGFWAKSLDEELPNKNLVATFIIKIEDVTTSVLKNTNGLSEEDKQNQIRRNIQTLVNTYPKENWQENRVRSFFGGNQYMLFVTETFKDVRLVGAPPSSIGKFGSDTDNWVWPRHTGDFSIFRIYADKDNRPAEYSENNVPYKPKHYFPISLKGVQQDDFTMVFGYPGRTEEYLPAVAVQQIVEVLNPIKIHIRDEALKVQDKYMRQDKTIKIQYASKYARIANYWKKWIGENQGLIKSNAVQIKKEKEELFQKEVIAHKKLSEYGTIISDFDTYYKEIEPYALARDIFSEVVLRNVELLNIGYQVYQLKRVYEVQGKQSFEDRKNNLLKRLKSTYKDYDSQVDKDVFEKLIAIYIKKTPKQFLLQGFENLKASDLADKIYNHSALTSYEGVESLLNKVSKGKVNFEDDLGVKLVSEMASVFWERVAPKYEELDLKIQALQRTYMKAILEFSKPEDRIFPDANSTLRVTYGKVKGYSPKDAVHYEPFTYLDGIMEKYIPNDYEFDVPQKLRTLYENKDYGMYGENGKMPVCFIATNHTTGGNSGSPAIDAEGNLIGLNFDRVWEGTMSDIYYDPAICRNIMVDIRYVLFIIDKYAGATHLIDEMTLIKN